MRAVRSAVVVGILGLAACSEPRQVSHSGNAAYEASLTAVGDGFAVAWSDTRDGNAEIYARLVDSRGRPRGPARRLTVSPESSYEADITAVHDDLAVAWYEKSTDGTVAAKLGLWTRDGVARWVTPVSSDGRHGRNPLVRVYGRELFCAWIADTSEGAELMAGWWDLDGRPIAPARRLAAASRTTWNLNAALDEDGRAWVVFDAVMGTRREELFLVRADKTTSTVVRLTSDDGSSSKYPDIVFGERHAALAWFDTRDGNEEVYLVISSPDGLDEALEARARRVTSTSGASIGAYVGWNGRQFGLAWNDDSEGQAEIYFQPFDPSGTPAADASRLTHNLTFSSIPAIQPLSEGFALVWTEHTPAGTDGHDPRSRSEIAFAVVR